MGGRSADSSAGRYVLTYALQVRLGGVLMLLAAGVGLLVTVLAPPQHARWTPAVAVLLVLAAACGAAVTRWPEHVPRWLLSPLIGSGSVLVLTGMLVIGPSTALGDNEMFLLWPVLFAAATSRRRAVLAQVAFASAGYLLVLRVLDAPGGWAGRWITTSGTLLIAGLVVWELRARVDRLLRRMHLQANTDPLTGLLNRRAADAALEAVCRRSADGSESMALLLLDLDHFKALNDTYGHPAGDQVLRAVARTLTSQVRGRDVVARVGGEEFLLLMPSCAPGQARLRAEQIRAAVAATPLGVGPAGLRVTVSIGLAASPAFPAHPSALADAADRALYAAKGSGRDMVVVAGVPAVVVPEARIDLQAYERVTLVVDQP